MVCIVDTAEKIQGFLPTLERMVFEGLIAMSNVEVIQYTHRDTGDSRGEPAR
jgi:PII-like signaling protein